MCAVVSGMGIATNAQAPQKTEFETLWEQADAPHQADDYAQSEQLYKQILAKYPKSQRAALRIAIAQQEQGKIDEALESYDLACEIDPHGDWADFVLFYKARAAHENQRSEVAQEACDLLYALHPDSPFVARAKAIEAQKNGLDMVQANAKIDREIQAAEKLQLAMSKVKKKGNENALTSIQNVIDRYPDTAVSLRAKESYAHALIEDERYEEALFVFQDVLNNVKSNAPNSRIAKVAQRRIAGLYHAMGNKEASIVAYQDIVSDTNLDEQITAEAAMQSAGVLFEIFQHDLLAGKTIDPEVNSELGSQLKTLVQWVGLSTDIKIRAELMYLEYLMWTRNYDEFKGFGDQFIELYDSEQFKLEVATANFFIGDEAVFRGEYEYALPYLLRVIDLYPDSQMWPTMKHVERAYHGAIECYMVLENFDDGNQLLAAFESNFPESDYLKGIKLNIAGGRYERIISNIKKQESGE